MDQKDIEKRAAKATEKIRNVVNFVWFTILVFLLVGSCTPKREMAVVGLFLLGICWVANEILGRGIVATTNLFFSKNEDNKSGENDNANKEQ